MIAALEPYTDADIQTVRKERYRIASELGWDGKDYRLRLDNVNKGDACGQKDTANESDDE